MTPTEVDAKVSRAMLVGLVAIMSAGNDTALVRLQELVDRQLVPIVPSGTRAQRHAAELRRALADLIAAARRMRP